MTRISDPDELLEISTRCTHFENGTIDRQRYDYGIRSASGKLISDYQANDTIDFISFSSYLYTELKNDNEWHSTT